MRPDYIIGVDPGSKGAIGVINSDRTYRKLINLEPMTEFEILRVFQKIATLENAVAYLECVNGWKKDGAANAFAFGKSYGFLRAMLVLTRHPFYDVLPQVWQRGVRMGKSFGGKSQRKKAAKQQAEQWFPEMHFTQETADAMLIAEYGHRQHYPVK